MSEKANYGIDAPNVVRNSIVAGVGLVIVGVALWYLPLPDSLWRLHRIAPSLGASGISCLFCASVMLWGSKAGKLHLRDKILAGLIWRGDEQVLDVGCGHGLMLIGAAKHLTTGKATGIDIWQTEDQADNSEKATQANIDCEGVTSKVVLHSADARAMPFADESFDLILSSWAIHNIYVKEERAKALTEMMRVLKPEGKIVIADIRHGSEYALAFRRGGMVNLRRSLPNFLFVIPTMTISAQKPKRPAT